MDLPVMPPVKPMLAKAVDGLVAAQETNGRALKKAVKADPTLEVEGPIDATLSFEPKWDGFRCIIFRDGDEVELGSRNERPLTRYFPEMIDPIRASLPPRCVIDGELIIITDDHLDFDGLGQRIHPAKSRITMLAGKTPASFVAFDLLALDDQDVRQRPFAERRAMLESALVVASPPIHLTPTTLDAEVATYWFNRVEGAGLDGLIAKPNVGPYVENKRVQFKVKHVRSADVVVAGYRVHKDGEGVGSLLLGLFDDKATLHHVGVAASFSKQRRAEFRQELEALTLDDISDHPWASWAEAQQGDGRQPGGQSRWNATKDLSWHPIAPTKVAEVKYGSTLNGRFRGVSHFLRWRPDRTPDTCRYDQLQEPEEVPVTQVLAGHTE